MTSVSGTFANILVVKLVLQQQYSALIMYVKISIEAIVLFVVANGAENSASNLASLAFFLSSFLVVIFYGR